MFGFYEFDMCRLIQVGKLTYDKEEYDDDMLVDIILAEKK